MAVDTYGTGTVRDEALAGWLEENVDMRPGVIIRRFGLTQPIYQPLACYGHFGENARGMPWERTDLRLPAVLTKLVLKFIIKEESTMQKPVKTVKRQLLRIGSCALSALMVLGSIPAAAIDDGVTATYDEAYYAMTDYYGNLTDGSVVKSYRTNGISTLTDYGDYDEVINLTDGTEPTRTDGKTVFQLDESNLPGTFYFEGKTAKPL